MRRIVLILLVALAGCGTAASPTTAPASAIPTPAVGSPAFGPGDQPSMSAAPVALRVDGVLGSPLRLPDGTTVLVKSIREWSSAHITPFAGQRYVAVDLRVTAGSTKLVLTVDSLTIVEDQVGTAYPVLPREGPKPALSLPTAIQASASAGGFVAFEIPYGGLYSVWFRTPEAVGVVALRSIAAAVTPRPTAPPRPAVVADGLVALPSLSVKIWRSSVRYYAISGKNPTQLEKSAELKIPRAAGGERVRNAFAYVEPDTDGLRPTYSMGAYGSCTMQGLQGVATYRVTIPRWTAPKRVLPQLLAWWKRILEHTRWHEEQHVRIFEKWIPTLANRLVGKACSTWLLVVNRWMQDVTSAQNAFDARERTWYLAFPYKGPWIY